MRKNETVELEIIGTATDGSGIGRHEGMVVFVPGAAQGDIVRATIVKVLKNRAYAKLWDVLTPSKDRTPSDCEVSDKCGGCVFRHINYVAEKRIKSQRVADAVKRIGGFDMEASDIIAAESRIAYRNKAQYPAVMLKDGVAFGFYAPHSHRVVPCYNCLLQPDEFRQALEAVKIWCDDCGVSVYSEETGKGLLRHVYLRKGFVSGEVMVVIIANGFDIPMPDVLYSLLRERLGSALCSLQVNINRERNNVVMGKKCRLLFGEPTISDTICRINVKISPLSFYQVNRDMAEQVYIKAKEYAQPKGKVVLDLYCGVGIIGLSMASEAKSVIGVEIIPQAVKNAAEIARDNGIDNAEFICADAANAAEQLAERKIKPDIVLLDPPRKGCEKEVLETLVNEFAPERIVYISCDPATLARDMKILFEHGYQLVEYTPADLFPATAHIETVALLIKR